MTCDVCIAVCPTDVFDAGTDGIPVIARQGDCQTCFMCEAHCPADALFVAPLTHPAPPGSPFRDEEHVTRTGLLGSYRRELGWGRGRKPGARNAVGPELGRARITPAAAESS
ncbi:ferredoxin [Amorphoplanes digitatis]|nr:ferredoxin family protein [Actinoplanes digitatis]GID93739.1 ferredoxin [Actinoplanes digitatis]